jgi:nicotinamidase-related amidase
MLRLPERQTTVFVVIDIQEKLVPAIDPELYGRALPNVQRSIEACRILDVPVIVTEQYPKGLGRTVREVESALDGMEVSRCEKTAFSCGRDGAFLGKLASSGRKQVVLAGMETHVCVLQTAFDLLAGGYQVCVLEDAVSSRLFSTYRGGIEAMRQAGVLVLPTESFLFSLLKEAGTPEFKKVSSLVR